MRIGDWTSDMIGKKVTIRDQGDTESPAWVVRGTLIGLDHRILEPYSYSRPNTATKVTLWVGPDDKQVTELVLESDYQV